MNPSKAWNVKKEAGIFLPSKNLYRQCHMIKEIMDFMNKTWFDLHGHFSR